MLYVNCTGGFSSFTIGLPGVGMVDHFSGAIAHRAS